MRACLAVVLSLFGAHLHSAPLPLFDIHLHYNAAAREQFSPQEVLAKLDEVGIDQVLVSSTDDQGTQMLLEAAPQRVISGLRPYRKAGEIKIWMYDETVIPYLEELLALHRYQVFGEFHAFEEHIDLPVVQHSLALAKQHNLILHIHGDAGAVRKVFDFWPQSQVIWAHAGFDDPENVTALLKQYDGLWVDLSHRSDISTWGGLSNSWREAFIEYPDRYLIGSDTYSMERWDTLASFALDTRDWLSVLPPDVAERIAFRNAQRLFSLND